MPKTMKYKELEETYKHLQEQLLRGELDEEEFKTEVEQLRFEDTQGRQWKIGWYTGEWYRYEQGQWIKDTPAEQAAVGTPTPTGDKPPPAEDDRGRRSATFWLAPALILLLLLAGAALVVGWIAGWWSTSPKATAEPTLVAFTATPLPPTESPLPTSTPVPSPVPSSTPLPTATATTAATATSTPVPSFTPSPSPETATETATSAATETAISAATETAISAATETAISMATETVTGTVTAEAVTPTATPSLSGQIFFPVYDPERRTFDIHVVQLENGERDIVVEQASQPALSPNSKRLAFRSWDRAQRAIRVRELTDGNTWTWINFAEAARPNWSANSENIVFPSQQEPDRQWRVYRTYGLEVDRVRRHGGDIPGRVPFWMSDSRIVYWECPLNKCGLYVMQNDGTDPTQLTTYERDTAPAASPDASQVAFMSNRDGNWEIYIVSTQGPMGEGLKRLTKNSARDGLPTWSPDGKWLAFVSDRDGEWAVWAMSPNGSGQRKLFDLDGSLEGEIAFVTSGDQHGWTWENITWGP